MIGGGAPGVIGVGVRTAGGVRTTAEAHGEMTTAEAHEEMTTTENEHIGVAGFLIGVGR
jgi:hypothetical protein